MANACVGCGGEHDSIYDQVACLTREVRAGRAQLARARARLDDVTRRVESLREAVRNG